LKKKGLILFAHGSRDPRWARPFRRIASLLSGKHAVRVAYLERMRPTLAEALLGFEGKGIREVRIVPLFLGAGGHVRKDLPKLVKAAKTSIKVKIDPPIGEQDAVVQAIAAAIAKGSARRGGRASP
jgi:sirohydrochlorin cobaltochelatase